MSKGKEKGKPVKMEIDRLAGVQLVKQNSVTRFYFKGTIDVTGGPEEAIQKIEEYLGGDIERNGWTFMIFDDEKAVENFDRFKQLIDDTASDWRRRERIW